MTLFDQLLQEGSEKAPAALKRLADNLQKPPVTIMSQEEYDKLPEYEKCILICNMPGCGKVVCTHGMLCAEHSLEMDEWHTKNIKTEISEEEGKIVVRVSAKKEE